MEEKRFEFLIDGCHISASYSMKEILEKSEEEILEDMEVCTCNLHESVNHCECEPEFMNSSITDFRIINQ